MGGGGGWGGVVVGHRPDGRDEGGQIRVAIVARARSFPEEGGEGVSRLLLLLLLLRPFFFGRCLLLRVVVVIVVGGGVVFVGVVVGGRRCTLDRIRDGRSRNP